MPDPIAALAAIEAKAERVRWLENELADANAEVESARTILKFTERRQQDLEFTLKTAREAPASFFV